MKEDIRPLMVTIRCITFNQAPYIRQCLDGFVMQKTNFRYEAIVHDDASTDGTALIIREYAEKYPDVIKPIYESENQYSLGGFGLINKKMEDSFPYGKYIAECEGDDYWTDSLKLQKQVDFLEAHPDYGMVYTAYQELRNGHLSEIKKYDFGNDSLREYLSYKGGIIATASVLFRAELYNHVQFDHNLPMGDVPLWIQLMHLSKAKYLDAATAVYRFLDESACHSKDYRKTTNFGISAIKVRKYYAEEYGYNDIAEKLGKKIRKAELLLDLYDLKICVFMKEKPWRYGIGFRKILHVLKRRFYR